MSKSQTKNSGSLCSPVDQGNTKVTDPKSMRSKRRSYRFTLNNYDKNEPAQLAQAFSEIPGIKKYVFQEEVGLKNKTPHLQGCVFFKNQISFASMKKINRRINWQRLDYPKRAIAYCLKSKSRKPNGIQWHYGINVDDYKERPKVPLISHRELLDNMCEQMKENSQAVAKEWIALENKLYGTKYKYLD